MEVGVAGCVWGAYHEYVRKWYDSLVAADTAQIVLVTDRPRPDIPCEQVVDPPHGEFREASWWTVGGNRLDTPYRATLGVDDVALHDIWQGVTGDVWLLGMRVVGMHSMTVMPPYNTAGEYLREKSIIACHASPFQAEWFEGYPQVAYSDWKIYLDMARRGAEFVNSGKVGIVHYEHEGSLSRQYADDHKRHRAEALGE